MKEEYRNMEFGDYIILGILFNVISFAILTAIINKNLIDGLAMISLASFSCGIFLFLWYGTLVKSCNHR